MWKKWGKEIVAILLTAGVIICASGCSPAPTQKRPAQANTVLQTTAADFKNGKANGTVVDNSGDGGIRIAESSGSLRESGTYESEEIDMQPFHRLLLSCNADTPGDSLVKVEVQVEWENKWSEWFLWGEWGSLAKTGSSLGNEQDEIAEMSEDVLQMKDQKTGDAVRYRLTLSCNTAGKSPEVRTVALSVQNDQKAIQTMYQVAGTKKDNSSIEKVLNVDAYSQMTRDPKIAVDICSPTSLAMVMNYYGIPVLPEEAAWGSYDNSALLFGNWAYNCAYAGSYGLVAYSAYINSLDDIKDQIAQDRPVVVSVRYKKDESISGDLPVLHGAPIDKTEGHLLVVRGFRNKNGKEYVVANDPAASDDNGVSVEYLADEFEKASFHVIYVIYKERSDEKIVPRRIQAQLVPTGKTRQGLDGLEAEYMLSSNGKSVDVSRNQAKTIMYTLDQKNYQYLTANSGKTLWLKKEKNSGEYSFLVIMADRKVYAAQLSHMTG